MLQLEDSKSDGRRRRRHFFVAVDAAAGIRVVVTADSLLAAFLPLRRVPICCHHSYFVAIDATAAGLRVVVAADSTLAASGLRVVVAVESKLATFSRSVIRCHCRYFDAVDTSAGRSSQSSATHCCSSQ